ncbi:alpha/beta fold hydrolase [Marinicella litoralis]|uniref:Serine aminopeptidase S33 family n=1 Tax=Marinicella litoralis TaxID=644220 RepID=A0A4R6XVG1_9GAMM|nr:alpha/beta hydrolase [Marinicella litoralis]TDR20448.1 serine aminopeptidase S33 family [Marinicella litoralis]
MLNKQPKELVFETRYGNIAALQWGTGNKHKTLALHGWLDNAASFWHLAPILAEQGMEITAIDFPGHGLSDHRAPGHNYGFIDYVIDIQAVIDQMEKPITLLCHSMGAAIAVMYAAAYPEQIDRLILIENLGPVPPYIPGKAVSSLREALKLWRNHSLEHKRFYPNVALAIKARQEATPMDAEIIRPLVERGLCQTKKGFHWRTDKRLRLRSFFRMSEEQIQEYLAATQVPTQLIIAEPRTYALQYPMVEDRIKTLNPAQFNKLDGDHHLHMSHARAVANSIATFMARPKPEVDDQ